MKDEDIKLPELPNADLFHRVLYSTAFRSFYSPEQMTEYAREAVRLNQPKERLERQAESWLNVCDVLDENDHNWIMRADTSQEAAVKTIQDLFDKTKKETSKPLLFDLEAAKRGDAIVTRDGRKAEFIAHDPSFKDGYQLITKVDGEKVAITYHSCGLFVTNAESNLDLFMSPKPKRVVYLNLTGDLSGRVWNSQEEAEANATAYGRYEIIALPVELP